MEQKTVIVSEEAWEKLMQVKLKERLPSIADALDLILKERDGKKNRD